MAETVAVGIEGVHLLPLTARPDGRGSFTEIYRREWIPEAAEMRQANLSVSREGVLRGLHFHRNQADYWCVVAGTAFVGLYDLRQGSPTQGQKAEIRVVPDERRYGLYIPKGVAHGFYAETHVHLHYLVDEYFTGEDDFGLAWDDREVAIGWPTSDPILSERDRSHPALADVLKDAPRYRPAVPSQAD